MPDISRHLADTLKRLRTARGWSLDRTAAETGVSKAMLGQIERGESSPTVATLWKIAGGFACPLSDFLDTTPAHNPLTQPPPTRLREADAVRARPASDAMLVAPLFPFDPALGFELLELTLMPGYERRSDPHRAGTLEHVVVLRGAMELLVDGAWLPLAEGAAVRFPADRPHGYRNPGTQPVVFHNLICHPAGTGRQTEG